MFLRNFLKSLAAVLLGNAIYFALLLPHLPEQSRHGVFQIDFGLLIDFWICLILWGVINVLDRKPRSDQERG